MLVRVERIVKITLPWSNSSSASRIRADRYCHWSKLQMVVSIKQRRWCRGVNFESARWGIGLRLVQECGPPHFQLNVLPSLDGLLGEKYRWRNGGDLFPYERVWYVGYLSWQQLNSSLWMIVKCGNFLSIEKFYELFGRKRKENLH